MSRWAKHERESAQAGAFLKDDEYILHVRLDDSEIPGLLVTTGYILWSNAEDIADQITAKLGKLPPRASRSFAKALQQVEELATSHVSGALPKGIGRYRANQRNNLQILWH